MPNHRMYANVIVWSPLQPFTSEAFFTLLTNGTIREIKSHRTVTENQYLEYVASSLFLGKQITFEVCNADFKVVQSATTPLVYQD